jgi:hypothetical protein
VSNIAEVIDWKFDGQAGMRCKANPVTGILEIVEFPGGIPSQADQDLWTTEYEARDIGAERVDRAFPQTDVAQVIFQAFLEIANRLDVLEGGLGDIAPAQLKTWLKNKLP